MRSVLVALLVIALALIVVLPSRADSKETVLHAFMEDDNGAYPLAGVILDAAGNIYGTTSLAGANGAGTVFELVPSVTGWSLTVLHTFNGTSDGGNSHAGLIFDKSGRLYGTASSGGTYDSGTVFQMTPSASGWQYRVIHAFRGGNDGIGPSGELLFDGKGVLFGTTASGGSNRCGFGCGMVFTLKRSPSGKWTERVLYRFQGGKDGAGPVGSLVFDAAGNAYGTTAGGGSNKCNGGCGTAFRLTRTAKGTWKETVLYRFTGKSDGWSPQGGLTFDAMDSLYGTTYLGGNPSCNSPNGCGVEFKLSKHGKETVLHRFTGTAGDGSFPMSRLVLGAGHLYGTTVEGGSSKACEFGCGTVFRVSKTGNLTVLHSFDGTARASPYAPLSLDGAGHLYSTTFEGGSGFAGVVFKLTP